MYRALYICSHFKIVYFITRTKRAAFWYELKCNVRGTPARHSKTNFVSRTKSATFGAVCRVVPQDLPLTLKLNPIEQSKSSSRLLLFKMVYMTPFH